MWQLLHWTPVTGICGGVFMPVAVVPLWQLEQLVSVDAWVNFPPAQLAKAEAALAWQVTQSRPPVATWPGKDAVPMAPVVPSPVNEPLWQESHRLALTAVWPVTHRVGDKARRRIGVAVAALNAATGMCGGVFIPVAVVPLWQLEQLVSVDA